MTYPINKALLLAAFLCGGIFGVLLIRAFALDPIEQMGWSLFWSGVAHAEVMNSRIVLGSSTFAKCCCGFLGMAIGAAVAVHFFFAKRSSVNTIANG
jgi:hypothetical protein